MGFEILTDDSLMPFGKHKGIPMSDVPVGYLHWLWNNGAKNQQTSIAVYIRENLTALKLEDEDLIWDK